MVGSDDADSQGAAQDRPERILSPVEAGLLPHGLGQLDPGPARVGLVVGGGRRGVVNRVVTRGFLRCRCPRQPDAGTNCGIAATSQTRTPYRAGCPPLSQALNPDNRLRLVTTPPPVITPVGLFVRPLSRTLGRSLRG